MGTIGTTLDPLAQATYSEAWLAGRDRLDIETSALNGNGNGNGAAAEPLNEASLVQ